MPSSQSFCCTFLQPTVVDPQQMCGGKDKGEEADERLGEGPVPWFLWDCVAFLLLTAKQHVVTDCLKSLISGDCITCQTVGMLFLFRCTVLLLLLLLFCRCCLVGFLEREIQKRDIHKTDNHPHPLIITFKKKLELRVEWRQTVGQAPAQSKGLLLCKLFFIFKSKWKLSSH